MNMFWQEDDEQKEYVIPDDIVDLSFKIDCKQIALDHAHDLSMALHAALPWLADEEDAGVAILAARGIEDGARHDVVAARLEHEAFADPVVLGDEIGPPRARRLAFRRRKARGHHPDRVATGMRVDAGEGVAGQTAAPGQPLARPAYSSTGLVRASRRYCLRHRALRCRCRAFIPGLAQATSPYQPLRNMSMT